jgi:cation:H+ antiporter
MSELFNNPIVTYMLFIAGFILLIKGADLLVDGAAGLARRFHVSELVIGLTIVSFGTSAPELVVNLVASFEGSSDLAIGNIIGSNIANILLILGISAVIYPISVQRNTVWKEIPMVFLAAVVVIVSANDVLLDNYSSNILGKADGLVLLFFFIIFAYYTVNIAVSTGENPVIVTDENESELEPMSVVRGLIYIVFGLVGLSVGAQWIVDGGVLIARNLGLSQSLIGLTVVAVGTSLPELAASAVAAYKKKSDIAIGNVVGSNIFNVFWILGISSIINPIPFDPSWNVDLLINAGVSALLFGQMFLGKKQTLTRPEGIGFIFLYIIYIGYVLYRG